MKNKQNAKNRIGYIKNDKAVEVSRKQIDLIKELQILVSFIRYCENTENLFFLLKTYYTIIFDNFEDVKFLIKEFDYSYLSSFFLDDTIKLIMEDIKNKRRYYVDNKSK